MENTNCIFCKIIGGEIPAHKVYEDDNYLAFLDINPATEGHTLVIPKKHYQWVYDVEDIGEYWEVIQKITNKMLEKLKPAFVTYYTSGVDVPHAHVHVLPRKEISGEIRPKRTPDKPSEDELKRVAEKIRN